MENNNLMIMSPTPSKPKKLSLLKKYNDNKKLASNEQKYKYTQHFGFKTKTDFDKFIDMLNKKQYKSKTDVFLEVFYDTNDMLLLQDDIILKCTDKHMKLTKISSSDFANILVYHNTNEEEICSYLSSYTNIKFSNRKDVLNYFENRLAIFPTIRIQYTSPNKANVICVDIFGDQTNFWTVIHISSINDIRHFFKRFKIENKIVPSYLGKLEFIYQLKNNIETLNLHNSEYVRNMLQRQMTNENVIIKNILPYQGMVFEDYPYELFGIASGLALQLDINFRNAIIYVKDIGYHL